METLIAKFDYYVLAKDNGNPFKSTQNNCPLKTTDLLFKQCIFELMKLMVKGNLFRLSSANLT